MVEHVAREAKISFLHCLTDHWVIYFNCTSRNAWTSCFSRNIVRQVKQQAALYSEGFCAYLQSHWSAVRLRAGLRLLCSSNHWHAAILLFCYSVFKKPFWVRASVLIQLQLCLLTGRVVTKGGLGLGNNSLTGMKASLPTRFSLAWSLYFSAD